MSAPPYVTPPTLEITAPKCIWSRPTFATGCHFSLCSASTHLVDGFKEEGKACVEGNWGNVGGAITGNGEGTFPVLLGVTTRANSCANGTILSVNLHPEILSPLEFERLCLSSILLQRSA